MKLTLEELLKGKSTIIKSRNYFSTEKYVSPFIETMSKFTSDFVVNATLPMQLTTDQATKDITYNRVWIQAVLPDEHAIDNHKEVIGVIYALDTKKPLYKIYRGYLNQACLNLCVFNPTWIETKELQTETALSYDIPKLLELENDFEATIKEMKSTFIDRADIYNHLGKWVDNSLKKEISNNIHTVKLSPEVAISAYKSVFLDDDSKYYVPPTQQCSTFHMYNAFTQIITDDKKDIINPVEKTLLVNMIL